MKKVFVNFILALCALSPFAAHAQNADKETFIVECIDFTEPADWFRLFDLERRILMVQRSPNEPTTGVMADSGGEYSVWAYTVDFPKANPGTRCYQVKVNSVPLQNLAGKHGKEGWHWEYLGKTQLNKGMNIISVLARGGHARADSILFTQDDSFKPGQPEANGPSRKKLVRKQETLEVSVATDLDKVEPLRDFPSGKKIGVQNKAIRVIFSEKKDASGASAYERSCEVFKDGKWLKLESFKDENLFMQYAKDDPEYDENYYFVSWKNPKNLPMLKVNSQWEPMGIMALNPYAAGDTEILRVKNVKRVDGATLSLTYSNGAEAQLTLLGDLPLAKFEIQKNAEKKGFYSFGMLGFNSKSKEEFSHLSLPTIFQNRRTMDTPKMVSNNFASQPLAIVEADDAGEQVSYGFVADPARLPFGEWSTGFGGVYAFSVASPKNRVQPAVFQPILGGRDSFKNEGEKISASWYMLAVAGEWTDALELANEKVFDGSRLREAYEVSFSDAIANIAAYLKNADASAWSGLYKARTQIEHRNTGTQANPLAEIEVALLTRDEEYYKNISLPTIENLLSRKHQHFCADDEKGLFERNIEFGNDVYASVDRLLGNKNEFLKNFYTDGKGRAKAFSELLPHWRKRLYPEWTVLLGIYLAQPSPELLERARAGCDEWLEKLDKVRDTAECDYKDFINQGCYPYWWYLPEMYEITKDKKYLKAAEDGAFYSMSSLWSFPTPPQGEVEIHKGGYAEGIYSFWWHGTKRFRLGRDENAQKLQNLLGAEIKSMVHKDLYVLPEKKVDAMKVSRIGLGIEQHTTFLSKDTNYRNIVMPSWAAEMLQVYKHTGRDILMKYSRHSIIGRFSNFIGYYVLDYTDVMHDPEYPYKGPDVTSFYYHHAPCHFAQSYDYLVTQFEMASKGKITFPYVRQQGYVWFTDRIFGLSGSVFGDADARLVVDKGAVRADSPKVSILTARTPEAVWVFALNDSAATREVKLDFNLESGLFKGVSAGAKASATDADSKKISEEFTAGDGVKISFGEMGFAAVKIPAPKLEKAAEAPALGNDAYIHKERIAKGWGDMRAMRIRGPFGKDSIFVFLTYGFNKEGAKAVLNVKTASGEQRLERAMFPYEFSVYPLPQNEDVSFTLTFEEADGGKISTEAFTLKK